MKSSKSISVLDLSLFYLPTMSEVQHIRVTYNDVHNIIKAASEKIADWKPDLLIAIGEFSYVKFTSLFNS